MKKNILIVACYINLSFASMTIDQQIEAIRDAPSHQRVEMMNNLKRQLILMNQGERQQTIAKLRRNNPQTAPIIPKIPPTLVRDRVEYRAVENNKNSILVTQEVKQQSINSIRTQIPEIKTPVVQIPQPTHEIKTPVVQMPQPTPEIKTPVVQMPQPTPEIKTPVVQMPQPTLEIKIPEVKIPEQVPEVKIPEVKIPEKIPEVKIPEVKIPEKIPEVKIPEVKIPEVKIPEKIPEVKIPEKIPEVKIPDIKIPEQIPEVQIPENIRQEEQNTPQEPQPIQNFMGNHS